jgi:hypothetical protein
MPIKPKGHSGLGSLLRYLLECKLYEEEKRILEGKPVEETQRVHMS